VHEVRRGRSAAHELDVHVPYPGEDVAEQPPVPVDVVEAAVRLELDPLAPANEPLELVQRSPRVALVRE
jgi:hypothetical protein